MPTSDFFQKSNILKQKINFMKNVFLSKCYLFDLIYYVKKYTNSLKYINLTWIKKKKKTYAMHIDNYIAF